MISLLAYLTFGTECLDIMNRIGYDIPQDQETRERKYPRTPRLNNTPSYDIRTQVRDKGVSVKRM